MIHRFIIILIALIAISGCSLTGNKFAIKKNNIQKYLQEKNNYGTPMDNIYDIQLTCFEKISGDNFKESHNIEASQSIGEKIQFQSSFNMRNTNGNANEKSEDISSNSFGDFLEFSLLEDLNGEYFANINYSKKELKKLNIEGLSKLDVVSTISIEQEYYPTNKLPYKIFENKEGTDICYITAKW